MWVNVYFLSLCHEHELCNMAGAEDKSSCLMPVSRISWAYRSWFPIFLLLFLLYSRAGSTGIQKETNLGRIILLHTGTYSGSSTDYISFLLSDIASHWNDNVLLIKRHCTEIVAGVKNEKKIKWQRHVKHLFYHILQLSSVHSALKWMKPPPPPRSP